MIGTTLKHYEIESLLGRGGMGVVYRGLDTHLHRPVALKVLKPELVGDADRRQRFLREARAAAAVTHPAIAQVYDVDEEDGTIFIAMELVEGKTLRNLVMGDQLDTPQAIDIAIQVSEGLAKAHAKGVVHRDIKSDNIIVTPDGHAKILDFGLAKLLDSQLGQDTDTHDQAEVETDLHTRMGVVMGTIAYMSPEQARGYPVNQASDVFSLGVVVYEMLTGELPFHGESPLDTMHAIAFDDVRPLTQIRGDLPADLQRILTRCLEKKPERRYESAAPLATDLKTLKRDLDSGIHRSPPITARLMGTVQRLRGGWRLGPAALAVGGILLLAFGYAFVDNVGVGGIIALLFVALVVYPWVRNLRKRKLRRFIKRIRKSKSIQAISLSGSRITIVVDSADGRLYTRVNNHLERMNSQLFHGEPFEVVVRDNLSDEELSKLLREPGVAYVRKDVVPDSSISSS